MHPHFGSLESYQEIYKKSVESPEEFWWEVASNFYWDTPWKSVHDASNGDWYTDARTNMSYNCLDRHDPETVAIHWEPNNSETPGKTLCYWELLEKVSKCANGLKSLGVQKGDRVLLYMPMIPEAIIAMLACTRIGAIHVVVFAGFSAQALRERIENTEAKIIITAENSFRGEKIIPLRETVEVATKNLSCVERIIVSELSNIWDTRELDWNEFYENRSSECEAVSLDANDPIFILHTSGSTGKPKGIVHALGGYMVYAGYTTKIVFWCAPGNVFFPTADIGWITGHSYLTYGPLLNGGTIVLFEGVPTFPTPARYWEIIEKYKVNGFYTAPTAIRSLIAMGDKYTPKSIIHSLQILGSVGEPIDEDTWNWYHTHIGKGKCHIVDTWWQTETGGIMITTPKNTFESKPGFAGFPLPGIQPRIIDENQNTIHTANQSGELILEGNWPGRARTIHNDPTRFENTYFSSHHDGFITGDGAFIDDAGYYRITGRIDDVMNVSGHRIGTAELENIINDHRAITESAIIAIPDTIKWEVPIAFVVAVDGDGGGSKTEIQKELLSKIRSEIGGFAIPNTFYFVPWLPKTRSGKIMRRILRKITTNEVNTIGDVSTLLDPSIIKSIQDIVSMKH